MFSQFALNDYAAWSISFEESKEGTRAVILHSVLAPADTCSTRGVRLKFDAWQLGIQIERPKPHNCYGKNQNNEKNDKVARGKCYDCPPLNFLMFVASNFLLRGLHF